MVLTELLQNATEHAFDGGPGHVDVVVRHRGKELEVDVVDDGSGLPEGFDAQRSATLGLSIVRTLVESELNGSLQMGPAEPVGTRVQVRIPLG
jgi:two-component sensor histidine kinase